MIGGRLHVPRLRTATAVLVVAAPLLAVPLTPSAASAASHDYGAIAYSPIKQVIGYALAGNRGSAASGAIANCKAKGGSTYCELLEWFTHAWGAVAEAANGPVGWAYAWDPASSTDARGSAHARAMQQCVIAGGMKCKVAFDVSTAGVPGRGTGYAIPKPSWRYAAFGDSYSSGEGNGSYLNGTNTLTNWCHRSPAAYGYLLRQAVPMLGAFDFYSCSGAVTDDFYTAGVSNLHRHNAGEKAQLDRLQGNTASVTLTIGGDDLDFSGIVTRCVLLGCNKNTTLINARLAALKTGKGAEAPYGRPIHALSAVLEKIHQRAQNASIFVGGYPKLFGADVKYYTNLHGSRVCRLSGVLAISFSDAQWLNSMADGLNGVLAQEVAAAQKASIPATFVSVRSAFTSHGLCDGRTAWIRPVQLPDLRHSFHPTEEGQRTYATSFRKAERV